MKTYERCRLAQLSRFVLAAVSLTVLVPHVHAAASLMQVSAGGIPSPAQSLSLSFPQSTAAGNTIIVGFDFGTNGAFSSIRDSQGNTFSEVGTELRSPGGTGVRVYAAKNIAGGPDTVTITFSANASFLGGYLSEYAGLDAANPVEAQSGASGSSGAVSSGSVVTTVTGDVIYAYCVGDGTCTAGSGFTSRSTLNNALLEDMTAGGAGSYAATGTASSGWAIQMLALKPAIIFPPVISSSTNVTGTVGSPFSYQITASNAPTSFGAVGLPATLTVNTTTGSITGTPTTTGTYNVTLSATNSGGTGTAPLTLTVNVPVPVISSAPTASGALGSAFSYQITASNSPSSFGVSGLPNGLGVNTSTGQITGTPTVSGTYNVTLSATNSGGTGTAPLSLTILGSGALISHTIQISNDGDDGYYDGYYNSGWHSIPPWGADLVGSWGGVTTAWAIGYRFSTTGVNSGDSIQSAYLQLVSISANPTCGGAPCPVSTFRVYGVAQDDGTAFSGASGNTPLDVPYTTAYTDYTSTGPGDVHGSCQGNNNGQNTCIHSIDVTNIVREITSRPGWRNTSAIRFVMRNINSSAPNYYTGYEDFSTNSSRAATLVINPPQPTIVSSGGWGQSAATNYPSTYQQGPFVYPGASTLLLFLGDYYNFNSQPIAQPTISDNCGNTWNILAGPTNWAGTVYDMRSTVYYVQNPVACPAGDIITVATGLPEPIFLHFVAVAGSSTATAPLASIINSPTPGTSTTTANSGSVTLTKPGLLVSWIFGDSDAPHTFTPQAGFLTDLNSIPTYVTAVVANVSAPGSYQSQFSISPSADGWQAVTVGLQGP